MLSKVTQDIVKKPYAVTPWPPTPSAFFRFFAQAVDDYATTCCKTEIVDFKITSGSVLQVGETFTFKVKVTNQSQLDMRNVKVKVQGTKYADVVPPISPPFGVPVTQPFNLDAGDSDTTGVYTGVAKVVTSGEQTIVTACIDSWDASLDHILKDHSGSGEPEGTLNTTIAPD